MIPRRSLGRFGSGLLALLATGTAIAVLLFADVNLARSQDSRVRVSGRAALEDGKPVAGAKILAGGKNYQDHVFRGETKTDADGRFSIAVDPNHYLLLEATSGTLVSSPAALVVRDESPQKEVQLVLKPGTRVFGKVTMGKNQAPASGKHLTSYQRLKKEHHEFPKEEQLPKPEGRANEPDPRISHHAKANMQGEFEFILPPGRHWIMAYIDVKPLEITITDQKEMEVEMHGRLPELIDIGGNVVLQDDLKQGVPRAKISGAPIGSSGRGRGFAAVADGGGRFRAQRGPGEILVHAASEDGALAGFARLDEEEPSLVIPLGPTAAAHGRLIDRDTGGVLAKRRILWSLHVPVTDRREPDGSEPHITSTDLHYAPFGGEVTTDARGEFTIKGLVKGSKYTLHVMAALREHKTVGSVTPSDAKKVEELGDITITAGSK